MSIFLVCNFDFIIFLLQNRFSKHLIYCLLTKCSQFIYSCVCPAPQGPALDGSPKGCYAYGSDGGHIVKSVPEFVAVGEQLTTSLWGTVKSGGSYRYPDIVHSQYT